MTFFLGVDREGCKALPMGHLLPLQELGFVCGHFALVGRVELHGELLPQGLGMDKRMVKPKRVRR